MSLVDFTIYIPGIGSPTWPFAPIISQTVSLYQQVLHCPSGLVGLV